jgi:hypothetical protein
MVSIIITRNVGGDSCPKVIQLMILWQSSHYVGMTGRRPVPFPVAAIPINVMTARPDSCTTIFTGCRLDTTLSPHDSNDAYHNATDSNSDTYHNTCEYTSLSELTEHHYLNCISCRKNVSFKMNI